MSSSTWVTVPMGNLDDPSNTFWEEFARTGDAGQWVERTPPDVADNGGIVVAPMIGGEVVGFHPSNLLRFSPLAQTTDGGASYTPGLLPGSLADVPDALSVGAAGGGAALTTAGLLTSTAGLTDWHLLASAAAVNGSESGTSVWHRATHGRGNYRFRHHRPGPHHRQFVFLNRSSRPVPAIGCHLYIGGSALAERIRP